MQRSLAGVPTPQAMVKLASSAPAGTTMAYAASFANWQWLAFVPTGPNVIGLASDAFYNNGGTANYTVQQLVIMDSTRTTVLFTGGRAYVNSTGLANMSLHVNGTGLTPGTTYSLVIQYVMQGGATTTTTDLKPQLDVYQVGSATTPV